MGPCQARTPNRRRSPPHPGTADPAVPRRALLTAAAAGATLVTQVSLAMAHTKVGDDDDDDSDGHYKDDEVTAPSTRSSGKV